MLDLGLPDPDGVEVIRRLRAWTPGPTPPPEIPATNPGKLITQGAAAAGLGSGHEHETPYIRQYMAHLRRKLEDDPARPRHLRPEPGMGYRFAP